MVVIVLLLIILILLLFIRWLYIAYVLTSEQSTSEFSPTATVNPSIVGVSRSVMLEPVIQHTEKPSAAVPAEEMDSAFMNNEFEQDYDDEKEREIPEEEQNEVIETEGASAIQEDIQIQKRLCADYEQILSAATKVAHNAPLDINDVETLRKLEGTDIAAKLEQAMPTYQAIVSAKLAELEY